MESALRHDVGAVDGERGVLAFSLAMGELWRWDGRLRRLWAVGVRHPRDPVQGWDVKPVPDFEVQCVGGKTVGARIVDWGLGTISGAEALRWNCTSALTRQVTVNSFGAFLGAKVVPDLSLNV